MIFIKRTKAPEQLTNEEVEKLTIAFEESDKPSS